MNQKRREMGKLNFHGFETNIEQIYDMYKAGEINLTPEYQRRAVWTKPMKQALIDSILHYDLIGLILFNEQPDGIIDVVDGQQRLRSIFEYIDGKFETDPFLSNTLPQMGFKDISADPDLKHEFFTYPLVSNMLKNYDDETVADFFVKINTSQNLELGEKLHAIPSYVNREYIKKWAKHPLWKKTKMQDNRLQIHKHLVIILDSELRTKKGERRYMSYNAGHGEEALKQFGYYSGVLERLKYNTDVFPHSTCKRITKNLEKMYSVMDGAYNVINSRITDFYTLYFFFSNLKELNASVNKFPTHAQIQDFICDFYAKIFALRKKETTHSKSKPHTLFTDTLTDEEKDYADCFSKGYKFINKRTSKMMSDFLIQFPNIQLKDPKRPFDHYQKLAIFNKYDKVCNDCGAVVEFDQGEFDHIQRHCDGGVTSVENGQLLCSDCHVKKTVTEMSK